MLKAKTIEKEGKGGQRSEHLDTLCHESLFLLYIFVVYFYDNSSVFEGYLQEPLS